MLQDRNEFSDRRRETETGRAIPREPESSQTALRSIIPENRTVLVDRFADGESRVGPELHPTGPITIAGDNLLGAG